MVYLIFIPLIWITSMITPDDRKLYHSDQQGIISRLEILDVSSGERSTLYEFDGHLEAPNWTPDGHYLIYNSEGSLYRIPVTGGTPTKINTGFANRCNNDHGVTADGKTLIISHNHETKGSLIYRLPIEGGTPELITPKGPSYWHGVSPDGKTITYCARRNDEYDVYIKPIEGGEERQLTKSMGLDDGPEFSPDGRYIYFNSARTGTMQIWRMTREGKNQTQITFDEYNDWFAHPSPDGKKLIFLSYLPEVDAQDHPPNKKVMLRMINLEAGGEPNKLIDLFGGQGSINVPSWDPASERIAFVSYELLEN